MPVLPRRRWKPFAASVLALSLAVAGVALTATPASAANPEADPADKVGDLTLVLKDGATASDVQPYKSASATTSCPADYSAFSLTYLVFDSAVVTVNTNSRYATAVQYTDGWGLKGEPINITVDRNLGGAALISDYIDWAAGPERTVDYLITCSNNVSNAAPGADGVKYFSATIKVAEDGTLSVVPPAEPPIEKIATSFTDVSVTAKTATSATLSATIAPADATGDVTFTSGDKSVTGTLSGGVATASVSGLTGGQEYTFTASYAENATHLGATKDVTFTTDPAAEPADSATAQIGANVPAATPSTPGGLKLTAKPGAVTLTGVTAERAEGTVWETVGQLGDVTVNDDRRTAGAAWSLTGKSGVFADGAKQIQASNLGWKPTPGTGPGVVGAEVVAGEDGGLSTDRVLVSGTGSAEGNQETTVGAGLTLRVPADAEQGDYSATLTLTLI